MSWSEHHSRSEELAAKAEKSRRRGDTSRAEGFYRKAAEEESEAFQDLKDDKQRSRGITAVSTVALWYKGRDYAAAELFAHRCLMDRGIPLFAASQLRDLLEMIWAADAAEKAGVKFVTGDVLVSVKGGLVIHGGAPLDLIVQKVEGIRSVLYRTVEMLLDRPFRKRGGPPADIQSMFRPWLFQAAAGSYQFAVRMEEPRQQELWDIGRPRVESVTETFFKVLRATSDASGRDLQTVVPDKRYCEAFLNLSRNLAPTGKTFERLEVRDASSPSGPVVTFISAVRQDLNVALRKFKPTVPKDGAQVAIRGVLRGLHLDKDWLEVTAADRIVGHGKHVRIDGATDVLDDVVGPMVNKKVVVTAVQRRSKILYRDIELDE